MEMKVINFGHTTPVEVRIIKVDASSIIHDLNDEFNTMDNLGVERSIKLGAYVPPVITCEGALSNFECHHKVDNGINVSIMDGGAWVNLTPEDWSNFGLAVVNYPGMGAYFKISNTVESNLKIALEPNGGLAGLLVNPTKAVDQVNSNKAFILYDADGNVIDPFDPANHNYNAGIADDISTNEEYFVLFSRVEFCLIPTPAPIEISCDGATDISGCIDIEGTWDLEVDGEIWTSNKNPDELAVLLMQSGDFALDASCRDCLDGIVRSIDLPYSELNVGDVIYLPIALAENGVSITTPITVGDTPSMANNITDQLNAQLEPYGLYAVYGIHAGSSIQVGIPDNRARDYSETIFYVLDAGNTFTPAQIPRGLPPFYCWMPT